MSSNSHRGASFYGNAAPYRSREGLSTRPVASSDEIQLHIDPGVDFDDEITGLRGQVRKLKNVFHYCPHLFVSLPIFSFNCLFFFDS
ncbi:Bet1-like protein isoform C [Glycine soja]|uniref:Bet1-like protein isoform B n=1 Tax=Glycine soja TaxID=3848 RepID=A0A445KY71_GLYSO|nr:Bet1-like protein isoform B [Glycine soja]RZC15882.1 Bet1-like protein isoform C [Glycine soja]